MRKVCSKCVVEKDISEFGLKYGKSIERCKECRRKYASEWYGQNRKLHIDRVRKSKNQYAVENRKFIWQYKKNNPCVDCGESDPRCLDFDHLRDKKYNISRMTEMPISKLKEEIEKCVIRCSNCHRKKTHNDFGWYNGDLVLLASTLPS